MKQFVPAHIVKKQLCIAPSKSYAQRALLAAAFCKELVHINGIGKSEDVLGILKIVAQFGATITPTKSGIQIHGGKHALSQNLNCGESGLGVRLTTAFAAVLPGNFIISGTGSLLKRPMDDFETILPQLNVAIKSSAGYLPLELTRNAKGGVIKIDGSNSSQYLSGLLMALPLLKTDSQINVSNLNSIPYIDCTIAVLNDFGIKIEHSNYEIFKIKGNQTYTRKTTYKIEGDYSGASIWMVHGAINQGIQIEGLNEHSLQADKQMLNALAAAGISFQWKNSLLNIQAGTVKPFYFDATHCPDLFPSLVVLAAAAYGISRIKGVSRLAFKESNRAIVLKEEFGKLGLKIENNEDEMIIYGTKRLKSNTIIAHNDHRIAMAGGIAATLSTDGITIDEAESVAKSYPNFWDELLEKS